LCYMIGEFCGGDRDGDNRCWRAVDM